MSLNLSAFKNIVEDDMASIEKFLKRDFLEIQHIKDQSKIDSFFEMTIQKNLERLTNVLLKRNPQYGIMIKNEITKDSPIGLFWIIDIIDDSANFINSIEYWGVNISIYDKKNNELLHTFYYMPILENTYTASKQEGVFLNNKRLDVASINKKNIYSNFSSLSVNLPKMMQRNFGSEILSLFFYVSGKINQLYLNNSKQNKLLSELIVKEAKGNISYLNEIISIGKDLSNLIK